MKLKPADTARTLEQIPPQCRAVVLFGPDAGLTRERLRKLALQKVQNLDDPFNLVTLEAAALKSDPARLSDEAAAISMFGGSRVIMVPGADEACLAALNDALSLPTASSLILLEAGTLSASDKLRRFAESSPIVIAMPSYAEGPKALAHMLRAEAEARNFQLEADAATVILDASGSERDIARQELEKLILYAGGTQGRLTKSMAQAVTAGAGEAMMDELVQSILSGQSLQADHLVEKLLDEGAQPISIIRAVGRRLWSLAAAHAAMSEGRSAGEVADALFGRMAWKEKPGFLAQLARWSASRTEAGLARLAQAERDVKSSLLDSRLIASRCMLALSR